ncbi:MAG: galactose-1-epimerase, partial [Candidatus Sulfotelmatobacter sp.]
MRANRSDWVAIFASLVILTTMLQAKTNITKQPFGHTVDGTAVDLYTLADDKVELRITNYGGIIVSLRAPDRNGKFDDIVLGYDSLDKYIAKTAYFGAIIGRYANRIAHGSFQLDGKTYSIPKNDGDNTLHGGIVGF